MGEVLTLNLFSFEGVSKFKSVRRAIRKGNMAYNGLIYPKRPFNNRKNRPLEEIKKQIFFEIKKAKQRNGRS